MRNIWNIAKREFLATVATRAFIIGLLIVPAIIAFLILVIPRFFNFKSVKIQGDVMVIDPTGRVFPELQSAFDPKKIEARRSAETKKVLANAPKQVQQLADKSGDGNIAKALGPIPDLHLLQRPADSNIEKEKDWLIAKSKERPHLALVVIHRDAVQPVPGGRGYGSYDLYVPPKLDDRIDNEIQQGLRDAIINARFKTQSLDKDTVDALVRVAPAQSITVTADKESRTLKGLNILFPLAFGFLLFMGVMGGGGQLLTTMVEEKSSRVVEVLLSAVSPMELMTGKLIGQMAASLLGMCIYLVMGLGLLSFFALLGLLNFSLIFYLILFFIITYLVMGSIMMAAGSAVNDMKEAQGLMAPMTILFIIPWILWMPISQDPGSTLSVVMSFLPPINTFAMLLRMSSSAPPPVWQVWLTIAIGIGSVFCTLWVTAKIFRIGLLMHGKPPNFATLFRWVRQA